MEDTQSGTRANEDEILRMNGNEPYKFVACFAFVIAILNYYYETRTFSLKISWKIFRFFSSHFYGRNLKLYIKIKYQRHALRNRNWKQCLSLLSVSNIFFGAMSITYVSRGACICSILMVIIKRHTLAASSHLNAKIEMCSVRRRSEKESNEKMETKRSERNIIYQMYVPIVCLSSNVWSLLLSHKVRFTNRKWTDISMENRFRGCKCHLPCSKRMFFRTDKEPKLFD